MGEGEAVGGYVIQPAKACGVTVIADASPDDEDLVRALGADHIITRGNRITNQIGELVPGGVPGSSTAPTSTPQSAQVMGRADIVCG